MSVVFDAIGPGANGNAVNSISWTHTPVGTPSAAGVWVGGFFNASDLGAATYGGATMSPGTTYNNGAFNSANAKSYGLASPSPGAQTVVVNGNSAYMSGNSISVTGSDPTTCFSNRSGNIGSANSGSSSTGSVTSAVGELVVDVLSVFAAAGIPSGPGASQTLEETDFWFGNINLGISIQPGAAGTVTATWSNVNASGAGQRYAVAIDSFLAPAGPAPPQLFEFMMVGCDGFA